MSKIYNRRNNLFWEIRNFFGKIKIAISNFCNKNYHKFTDTNFGKYAHKYFLRYIGKIFASNFMKGMFYLSPALVLLSIFTLYPIFNSLLLAFYDNYTPVDGMYDGFTLMNFADVFHKPGFGKAIMNTAVITFVTVPLSVIISLFIAVMLNSIKALRNFFQTVFFLPYVTNTIAIGLVFSFMFDYNYGIINDFLGVLGMSPVHWKDAGASYWSAMSTIIIYTIWGSLAFKIMIFTAGLQNIDKQFYDAAKVDGASKWRTFRRITVPLLSPMIAYVAITSFIGAFKAYTTVVAIISETGRTFNNLDLRTIVFYIYDYIIVENPLNPGNLSKGAAASMMLFGIILVFTFIQLYISKKRVHY